MRCKTGKGRDPEPLSFYCRLLRRLVGYGFKRLARPGECGTAEHSLLATGSFGEPIQQAATREHHTAEAVRWHI